MREYAGVALRGVPRFPSDKSDFAQVVLLTGGIPPGWRRPQPGSQNQAGPQILWKPQIGTHGGNRLTPPPLS